MNGNFALIFMLFLIGVHVNGIFITDYKVHRVVRYNGQTSGGQTGPIGQYRGMGPAGLPGMI